MMLNNESIFRVNQGLRIFKQRDASRTRGALARSVKDKLASAYQLLTEEVVQKGGGLEGQILFRLCVCPVNEFRESLTVSSSGLDIAESCLDSSTFEKVDGILQRH
jgi:hypothetical protein